MRLADARILIADDEHDLLENLAEIVEVEGASVRTAGTAAQALKHAESGFDVALIDVGLPDAEGVTLVPRLKELAPGAEILLITGQGTLDHALRALRVGAYEFVLKPFDSEALLASVERALRQVRSTRAAWELQRSLQRERDFISAVLDTAGALVVVLDREGRIVRFNRACEALSGYTFDEVRGTPVWDRLIPPEAVDEVKGVFADLCAGKFPSTHENHWLTRDGRRRLVSWSNTVLTGEDGAVTFAIATGIDITERRQAEQELRAAHDELQALHRRLGEEHARLLRAEKLSSIGQLSAGIIHEINNPLGGVMSCFKALRSGTVPERRIDDYLETIDDGLQRIATTVRGLLDYARQRPPAREPVDLAAATALSVRLVEPSMRKKGLRLVNELPADTLHAEADRSQIMQALVNVLLNAAHAAPPDSEISLHPVLEDDRVGVRISDQGPGIPPEIRDRICEPFFTTKPEGEGTGLGLSITTGIMRAHGGALQIDSEPGQGTAVTLWLPRR